MMQHQPRHNLPTQQSRNAIKFRRSQQGQSIQSNVIWRHQAKSSFITTTEFFAETLNYVSNPSHPTQSNRTLSFKATTTVLLAAVIKSFLFHNTHLKPYREDINVEPSTQLHHPNLESSTHPIVSSNFEDANEQKLVTKQNSSRNTETFSDSHSWSGMVPYASEGEDEVNEDQQRHIKHMNS